MKVREHKRYAAGDEALARVVVPLVRDADAWHDYDAEALWAEPLGDGRFLLRSPPFLAFDLAVEDVVEATADGTFVRVVERGGGSSYRVHCPDGARKVAERIEALEALEVTAEIDGEWVALDVPPQADLDEVYALLADGEEAGDWTFEEGWAAS